MSEITNMKDLQAAIKQLEMEAQQGEAAIKQHISAIKESLKPANIVTAAFNKITGGGELNAERRQSFSATVIKAGLALWLRKGLFKTESKIEQKMYDVIDSAFDHVKAFLKKKR